MSEFACLRLLLTETPVLLSNTAERQLVHAWPFRLRRLLLHASWSRRERILCGRLKGRGISLTECWSRARSLNLATLSSESTGRRLIFEGGSRLRHCPGREVRIEHHALPERVCCRRLRLGIKESSLLRLNEGLRLWLKHWLLRLLSKIHLTGLLGWERLLLCHWEAGHLRLNEAGLLGHHHGLTERVERLLLDEGLLHLLWEAGGCQCRLV